jgi:hypothetical protein
MAEERKQMSWTMYNHEGQRKYLTRSERASFLEVAMQKSEAVRTFCWMIAATGCRISEALALSGKNIDFEAEHVVIRCLKKRGKQVFRAIPLPTELLEHLKVMASSKTQPSERLWPWSRMTGYRRIREVMQQAGIAGAQATPKGLRHGFGVCAIQAKVPLNLVQRWLGHADIKTTAIYTSAMGPEEREIASRMWCDSLTGGDKPGSKASSKSHARRKSSNEPTPHCSSALRADPKGEALMNKELFSRDKNKSSLPTIGHGKDAFLKNPCHMIHFWLKCIARYLQRASVFSGR